MFARVCLALLLFTVGCASTGPLVGTWELLDGADPETARPTGSFKILNETHFAFGHPDGAERPMAGGGAYVYDHGEYVETIRYHWIPEFVGQTIHFECRLDGDLWFHTASFDAAGRHYRIDEVWRKVGPSED